MVYSIESEDSDAAGDIDILLDGETADIPIDIELFNARLAQGLENWENCLAARKRKSNYMKIGRPEDKPKSTIYSQKQKAKRDREGLDALGYPDIRDIFKRQKTQPQGLSKTSLENNSSPVVNLLSDEEDSPWARDKDSGEELVSSYSFF